MRSLHFILFILIFTCYKLYATHERGGEITFRHISSLTYEATIITYTKNSSIQPDRDTLLLDWGDGVYEKLLRSNGPIVGGVYQGVIIPYGDLKYNEYKSTPHTFPSSGNYYISTSDPNRTSSIININGGDSNQMFYIESMLRVGLDCPNNSVQFADIPPFFANLNQSYVHNIATYDIDGDSLSFELVMPLGSQNFPVPNYEYPNEINPGINNSFAINPISGTITWNYPQRVGTYGVAVKVNEWKNGWLAGYVIRDFQIIVENENFTPLQFSSLNNWQMDSSGNYVVQLNPYDTLSLAFDGLNADDISAAGEIFSITNSASFSANISTTINASLTWTPDSSNSRLSPYITVFRSEKTINGINMQTDLPLLIYVSGGERSQCVNSVFSGINENTNQNLVRVFPNPMERYAEIQIPENIPLNSGMEFKLYDMTGKNLLTRIVNSRSFKFQRDNLAMGIYFYSIRAEGIFFTGKLAVK